MARWVGVGTQQPQAGFEPTTSRLQVRHCTTQPPGNGECMFSAGCVPIFCHLYDAVEECNVVIGRWQTGVAGVTVLWLVIDWHVSQVSLCCDWSLTDRCRRCHCAVIGHWLTGVTGVPVLWLIVDRQVLQVLLCCDWSLTDRCRKCHCVVIGCLQTGVAGVAVLWLVVNRQVSLWCLPSQFRLLQVCESRQRHGSLEGIDALLGVLIVLSYRLIITFMSLTRCCICTVIDTSHVHSTVDCSMLWC